MLSCCLFVRRGSDTGQKPLPILVRYVGPVLSYSVYNGVFSKVNKKGRILLLPFCDILSDKPLDVCGVSINCGQMVDNVLLGGEKVDGQGLDLCFSILDIAAFLGFGHD